MRVPGWHLLPRVWDRFRKLEMSVLLAGLALAASAWAFVGIADEVLEGDTEKYDRLIFDALRSADDASRPWGPLWLEHAARDVTALGSWTVLVSMVAVVVLGLFVARRPHQALVVLVATLSGALLSFALKAIFARERPDALLHAAYVTSPSFPSGHSMNSAIVYLTLGSLLARIQRSVSMDVFILATAMLLTGAIGITRVYLGVHWPTDVLAGWSAGFAWATVCWLVAGWLDKRRNAREGAQREGPEVPSAA
jgi:undecaprenyl-diphosphatase